MLQGLIHDKYTITPLYKTKAMNVIMSPLFPKMKLKLACETKK